jgi:hypothetical protein
MAAAEVSREPARDPQDLERRLVSRQRAGDVDGMVALYEPNAVLDFGGGRLTLGREAIRTFYAGLVATGRTLLSEINAPALSRETWHSQLAFRMISSPWRSAWRGTPETWKLPARSKRPAR